MRWTVRGMMRSIAAIAILLGALIVIAPASRTNCGGNSAALAAVRMYSLIVGSAAAEDPDHVFSVIDATPEQRQELAYIADYHWIRPARLLVAPMPYRHRPTGPRRIIVVCERPFRNVPRRVLGLAPPSHAAAFSDGTCGLISVAEFEALDRSSFVPLDELLAAANP